ncbi:hypothetical protein O7627_02150 [Solwaraspora sp. WMMD1047]|uniref:hypothetical protein n=1 Tax=Solwaraspora sp. WMMD1047 TaxID=3016102 RepID=UPI00241630DD|nr:hypothetical protein [Solwaraspora sp. WMMD1047]MDG4828105.1 hypothetical protein [Solwaraspora sp. WMMD1047]
MRFLAVPIGLSLLVTAAVPAGALPAGHSVTNLAAQAALTITVPASRNLGNVFPGSSVSGQLGTVIVSDTRAINPNTWTVTVSSTAYTTGGASPAETIANSRISYWSGPQTAGTGGGNRVPGQLTSAQAQTLGVPRVAFSKTSGNQNNTCRWNPTVIVSVPAGAVAGLYTGRITHSVA